MSPKEKAKELVEHYIDEMPVLKNQTANTIIDHAKKSSGICVDEILKVTHSDKRANSPFDNEYWQQVKQEIEKL